MCFCGKSRKLLMMWRCFDRTRVWFCADVAVFFAHISGVFGWTSDGGGQVLKFCGRWMSAFLGVMVGFL